MGEDEPSEDEPSENEEQLRFVANAVPALLAYLDVDARYVWVQRELPALVRPAPGGLRGHHVSEVLGEDAWESLRPYVERVLAGEEVTFDQRVDYKNGPPRDVRASYVPHLDAQRAACAASSSMVQRHQRDQGRRAGAAPERAHAGALAVVGARRAAGRWRWSTAMACARARCSWSDETYRMLRLRARRGRRSRDASFLDSHPPGRSRARCAPPRPPTSTAASRSSRSSASCGRTGRCG